MKWILWCIALCSALQVLGKDPIISYTLSIPEPQTHYVEVDLDIRDWRGKTATVKMPVWTPGSYLIREYAQHVEGVAAITPEGIELPVTKIEKNTWEVANGRADDFTVYYRVYAYEYTVRTSYVDADHAALNLASICMFLADHLDVGGTLKFEVPENWKKATTSLPKVADNAFIRTFSDFDELIDSPVELGNHETFTFTAAGVPHTVAMIGYAMYDKERLTADLTKIVETCTAIFGDHPSDRYIFHVHNTLDRGGGLEHKNSTSVIVGRHVYHNQRDYEGLMSLFIHEYFHLWNAKRLRPKALGPFNYEKENYTTLLWQVEGFTSYYDEYLMQRMDMISADRYLRKLAGAVNSIRNTPGNYIQPVAESSMDAWIKYYRRNENSKNTIISYYTKGNVIAASLDLLLLHHSNGQYQLEDVLRYLYETYYQKKDEGFTEAQLKAALEEFAGIPLDDFFAQHIHGTQPVPIEQYLQYVGLQMKNQRATTFAASLGARTVESNGHVVVEQVLRNSAAWDGGLNVGDEIIAVNGQRVSKGLLSALLNGSAPGDRWEVLISRDGLLRVLPITLDVDTRVRYVIEKRADATPEEKALYEQWLNDKFDS